MHKPAALFSIFAICFSCNVTPGPSPEYANHINAWQEERAAKLMEKDSWLSLAGLYWLREGEQTFGADSSNQIVFPPKAPSLIGSFHWQSDSVVMKINEEVEVNSETSKVTRVNLTSRVGADGPKVFRLGSLSWHLLERGGKYGIRLKDSEHSAFGKALLLEYYPPSEKWRLPARFVSYEDGKKVVLDNVLGMKLDYKMEGYLEFEINGEAYRLDVMGYEDEFFIIFADATTGDTTYGGGRYLYAKRPEPGKEETIIDFNKAYNPPCVFTKFATCLLPPSQNRLEVAVQAGELFGARLQKTEF